MNVSKNRFQYEIDFSRGIDSVESMPGLLKSFFVEVSGFSDLRFFVYNVYITNQFQTTFAQKWGGGGESVSRGDSE